MISALDGRRLVFVDEMGTNTSLAPLYAYSRRGHRVHAKVPRNRGPNTTLLASITVEGMGPCVAVVGSTTKEVFETYVEQVLSPTLGPGQVVVMDNLAAHKGERMHSTGARSRTALLEALATALSAVTSRDARGFFEHCGYRLSAQPL